MLSGRGRRPAGATSTDVEKTRASTVVTSPLRSLSRWILVIEIICGILHYKPQDKKTPQPNQYLHIQQGADQSW
jgi:hypothetical protein